MLNRTRVLVLMSSLSLAACSVFFPPPQTPREPFAGGGRVTERTGGHRYRVTLEVRCNGCLISYGFGGQLVNRTAGDSGWRDVIYRTPLMREAVILRARGSQPGPRALQSIEINVDGEVVASDRCADNEWERTCSLGVETVIGPPGGAREF